MKKIYYHLLEIGNYNKIAHINYYTTKNEAGIELKKRKNFYPDLEFIIYQSNSKKEPNNVNI